MSSFIPSTLRTRPDVPQASTDLSTSSSSSLALPAQVYTDCQSCRITGTLTFSAVGLYALTVSRATAKTPLGKGAASLMGLGAPHSPSRSSQRSERQLTPAFLLRTGFLAVAAARWNTYSPPPVDSVSTPPA